MLAAGLGFLYWVMAARTDSMPVVGAAAASTTAMMFLAAITNFGWGTLLITELPLANKGEQRRLFQIGAIVVGGFTVPVALGFALLAPLASLTLARTFASPAAIAVFVVGSVATSVGLMMDRAVLGLERNESQLLRNLLASVVRLPLAAVLVVALGYHGAIPLVASWAGALVVAQVVQYYHLRLPRASTRFRAREAVVEIRRHAPNAGAHWALNLSLGLVPQLMPVVAAVALIPRTYAAFNMVWTICTAFFMVPYSMAITLLAVASIDSGNLSQRRKRHASATAELSPTVGTHVRKTILGALAIGVAGVVVTLTGGRLILEIFGPRYAGLGTPMFRVLVFAALPLAIKDHYFTLKRLEGRLWWVTRLSLPLIVLELFGAGLGAAMDGAVGLVAGWVLALLAEGAVMAPRVSAATRSSVTQVKARRQVQARPQVKAGASGTTTAEDETQCTRRADTANTPYPAGSAGALGHRDRSDTHDLVPAPTRTDHLPEIDESRAS